MSNTSKVFRSVVTGPSSAPLWVAARERVDLPELELPMTDLQYAHLLFGKGCAFCTRKNAGKAEVYFRARICTATMKDSFADKASTPGMAAINKAYGGSLSGHPLTLTVATGTSRKSYSFAERLTHPSAAASDSTSSRAAFARYGPSYYLPEVARLNAELKIKFPTEDSLNDRYEDRIFAHRRLQGDSASKTAEPSRRSRLGGQKSASQSTKRGSACVLDLSIAPARCLGCSLTVCVAPRRTATSCAAGSKTRRMPRR